MNFIKPQDSNNGFWHSKKTLIMRKPSSQGKDLKLSYWDRRIAKLLKANEKNPNKA